MAVRCEKLPVFPERPIVRNFLVRTITEAHIVNYAGITGDMNPLHVDAEYAAHSLFKVRIAHGMLVAGLISAVLGTQLPGPNSIYLGQDLKFIVIDGNAVLKKVGL